MGEKDRKLKLDRRESKQWDEIRCIKKRLCNNWEET
jgi:hypothetical protein